MTIEVTQTQQGVAFSVNGSPARPLPWIEELTFRQGTSLLTFKRASGSGPASELHFSAGAGYYILKRQ
jgi:hypothetical protein